MSGADATAPWDRFLTDRDRAVFTGYAKRGGLGRRPVVLVVDVNHHFAGDDPDEELLDAIRRWPHACGPDAWRAVAQLERLLPEARDRGVPVIYLTGAEPRADGFDSGRWTDKAERARAVEVDGAIGNAIVPPIAPEPEDLVLTKTKPSAFFGTLLAAYLVDLQADTLLVTGITTSGCVRATVLDGFSLNYRIAVVAECTADRGEASHALSLFDMDQKYADVQSVDETIAYLRLLPVGLFDERMPSQRAARDAKRLRSLIAPVSCRL